MTLNNIQIKMAFAGLLGFGYLRLHSDRFPHTRKCLIRQNLKFSIAYSELKYFLKMASGGNLGYGNSMSSKCKNTWRIGFLIPENP